ncbi:hypothetical protein ACWDBF_36120 [Streptomyces angustmyceticus]
MRTSPTPRTPTTSPAPAESASDARTTRSPRHQPDHDQSQRHFLYRNYSHPYKSSTGNVYARESSHWGITYK